MRWAAPVALALAGCSGEPAPHVVAPPATSTIANATRSIAPVATLDLAPPAPTKLPPDPPTASIPPELLSAPAFVFRSFATSMKSRDPGDSLWTYTLRRQGDRALLVIELQTRKTSSEDKEPWSPGPAEVYLGTASPRDKATTLSLVRGSETRTLSCAPGRLQVARASAVLVRGGTPSCSSSSCWVPRVTRTIDVLRCSLAGLPGGDDWDLAFAPAPGVEHVHVGDDTALNGSGFREIAGDGSVQRLRSYLP